MYQEFISYSKSVQGSATPICRAYGKAGNGNETETGNGNGNSPSKICTLSSFLGIPVLSLPPVFGLLA